MTEHLVASEILDALQRHLADDSLPLSVRENVEEHRRDIVNLAETLTQLGVPRKDIDHHVTEIFQRYENILALKVERIREIEESVVVVTGG